MKYDSNSIKIQYTIGLTSIQYSLHGCLNSLLHLLADNADRHAALQCLKRSGDGRNQI